MKKLLLCILSALTVLTACESKIDSKTEISDMPLNREKILEQLREEQDRYAAAWNNKDFDTISSMWAHDDDITMWDAGKRERIQGWDGPDGVKAWYQRAFASMETVDFHMHELLIKLSREGTSAVFTLYVENNFTDTEGNKATVNPRVTVVKELREDGWKLIHGDASYSIEEIK